MMPDASKHFVRGWKRPTAIEEAFSAAMAEHEPRSSKAPDWNFNPIIESNDVKWHRIYNEKLKNAELQRAALLKKKKPSPYTKKYLKIIQEQQKAQRRLSGVLGTT